MPLPRISLSEAFTVAVLLRGLLAALRFAGEISVQLIGLFVGALFLFTLMAERFGRGSVRAAGGGFALSAALYGAMFVAAGMRHETDALGFRSFGSSISHEEVSFSAGVLPTYGIPRTALPHAGHGDLGAS